MFEQKKPKPLKTVITYLEMTKPPNQSYQRPSNIQTALMRAENIPLHFYKYLQHQVGEKWNWVYRLRLSDEALSKLIHAETTEINVLYLDGTPAGFYEINRADRDQVDLAYFGMMEHAIGRGLGKWFLSQAIASAWESEPMSITVNTCTLDHPAALGLYQKLGFQPIKQEQSSLTPLSRTERLNLFG